MKKKLQKKQDSYWIPGISLFILFVLLLISYHNFSDKMEMILNKRTTSAEEVMNAISQFIYSFLFIYLLFLSGVFLFVFFQNHRINTLQNKLLLSEKKYHTAFSNFTDAIWEYDISSDTLHKSSGTGILTDSDVIPEFRSFILKNDIVHPDDQELFLRFLDDMLLQSSEPLRVQVRGRVNGSEYTWYEFSGSRILNAEGVPLSVIGHTANISSQKAQETLQQELSDRDKLTHLYNGNALAEMVDHYLNTIDRATISALFLIDLDNFSKINETLGHVFGDAVILDFSARLQKRFQSQDILGRPGGDSFAVFLTDAPSLSYIEECAAELCSLLHDIYTGNGKAVSISGSIGISIFPSDGNTYRLLNEKASRALYEAKLTGKDRYCIYSSVLASSTLDFPVYNAPEDTEQACDTRLLVNTNMIINAIDILFDSHEIDISIQMLLSLIGTYYNLDRLSIFQYNIHTQALSVTHEWVSHSRHEVKSRFQNIPYSQDSCYAMYKQKQNGVFYASSWVFEQSTEMSTKLSAEQAPQAIFQCGFSDHGTYIGYLCAMISDDSHTWSKSEIDSLTLISKIIGSYIARIRSVRHAAWIAECDEVTGAYNFNAFLSKVNKMHSEQPDVPLSIMYSDIYQFKLINDNYGYQTGDYVLKSIADMFRKLCPNAVLCRVSADKFAICLANASEDYLAEKARRMISHCHQLSTPEGEKYKISLIFGLYTMASEDTAIMAVDRANIARKSAQRRNLSSYAFFTSDMHSSMILRKDLEDSMEDSLLKNEFLLYYQPKFNITTRTVCGAEALVRWQHPVLGFLYPNSFIPLFESNGFIVDLDYYMFEQVCIHMRELLSEGKELFPISVNFSREHFKSNVLPDRLKTAVDFYNVPAGMIEIEVTESAFAAIDQHFFNMLMRLRKYGFRLSIDDFGAGLSSLNLLCDLPFNVVKIDKDFFHSKTTTERERIVISNIVRMTGELDMEVICEGVETEEQAQFLHSIGCDIAQGYLFSKPISKEEFRTRYLSLYSKPLSQQ